jgi:hypothetical protein
VEELLLLESLTDREISCTGVSSTGARDVGVVGVEAGARLAVAVVRSGDLASWSAGTAPVLVGVGAVRSDALVSCAAIVGIGAAAVGGGEDGNTVAVLVNGAEDDEATTNFDAMPYEPVPDDAGVVDVAADVAGLAGAGVVCAPDGSIWYVPVPPGACVVYWAMNEPLGMKAPPAVEGDIGENEPTKPFVFPLGDIIGCAYIGKP